MKLTTFQYNPLIDIYPLSIVQIYLENSSGIYVALLEVSESKNHYRDRWSHFFFGKLINQKIEKKMVIFHWDLDLFFIKVFVFILSRKITTIKEYLKILINNDASEKPALLKSLQTSTTPREISRLFLSSYSFSLLDMQADYGTWSNWSICVSQNKTCNSLGTMNRTRTCYNSSDYSILPNRYCRGSDVMMESCQYPCLHYGKVISKKRRIL